MENEGVKIKTVDCPFCGADEFVIEETLYQACCELWLKCRHCDWTLAVLPKINDNIGVRRTT